MPRFNQPGDIHFITFRTFNNKAYFQDEKCCQLFLENLDFYRNRYELEIYGYCLMPDHVHLLIYFDLDKYPNLTISKIMHGIKGYSAKLINRHLINNKIYSSAGRQGSYALLSKSRGAGTSATRGERWMKIWRAGFYDFNVYSDKKFQEKLDYIHLNPLKAGLVNDISQYKYCSWRNYELADHSIFKVDILNF